MPKQFISINVFLNFIKKYYLATIVLSCCIVLLWVANKGFDLSDESYYLMCITYANEAPPSFSLFGQIYNDLFGYLNLGLYGIRILRLVLFIISSFVLVKGFNKWLTTNKFSTPILSDFHQLFLFVFSGTYISYAYGPQTLTLNGLTLFFAEIIVGLFFYGISTNKTKSIFLYSILNGISIILLFLIKFPSAVLLATSLAAYILFITVLNKNRNWKTVFVKMTGFFIGTIAVLLFYFKTPEGLMHWLQLFSEGVSGADETHQSSFLIERFLKNLTDTIKAIIIPYLWLYILAFVIPFIENKLNPEWKNKLLGFLLIISLTIIAAKKYFVGGTIHTHLIYPYVLTGIVICVYLFAQFIVLRKKISIKNTEIGLVFLLLLTIPFLLSAGTNTRIFSHIALNLAFWFPAFIILSTTIEKFTNVRYANYFLVIMLSSIAGMQLITGTVLNPYRLNSTLLNQTNSLSSINPGLNIKVDDELYNTIKQVKATLDNKTNFKPNMPVFTYRHQTGIAYAVGGILPYLSWYNEKDPERICQSISKADLNKLNETVFIIPVSIGFPEQLNNCLLKKGLNFKTNYSHLSSIPYFNKNKNDSLLIFAPNKILK